MQFLSGAVQVANFVLFVALIPKDVKTKVLPKSLCYLSGLCSVLLFLGDTCPLSYCAHEIFAMFTGISFSEGDFLLVP